MTTIYIGMRAEGAKRMLAQAALIAAAANGQDGAFEYKVPATDNATGSPVTLIFNNDDMERDEMNGRTIVDLDP